MVVAVALFLSGRVHTGAGEVSEWHENLDGAFRIRPPPGWTRRTTDRDGSQIAPAVQPDNGFVSLIISSRLAGDPDPMRHLADVVARPPAGPIRELRWLRQERITLATGLPAAMGEFSQVYRGARVHGWMVLQVHEARLLRAVAVVPEDGHEAYLHEVAAALRSLEPM